MQHLARTISMLDTQGYMVNMKFAPASPLARVLNPKAYIHRTKKRASSLSACVHSRVAIHKMRKTLPLEASLTLEGYRPRFSSPLRSCTWAISPLPLSLDPFLLPPPLFSLPEPGLASYHDPIFISSPCLQPIDPLSIENPYARDDPSFTSLRSPNLNSPLSYTEGHPQNLPTAYPQLSPDVHNVCDLPPDCLRLPAPSPEVQAAKARVKAHFASQEEYRKFTIDQQLVEGFLGARSSYPQPTPPFQESPSIITDTTYRGHNRERPRTRFYQCTPGNSSSAEIQQAGGFADSRCNWASSATSATAMTSAYAARRPPGHEMLGVMAELEDTNVTMEKAAEDLRQPLGGMKLAAENIPAAVPKQGPQILRKPIPSKAEQIQTDRTNWSPLADLEQAESRVPCNVPRKKSRQILRETETNDWHLPSKIQPREREPLRTISPNIVRSQTTQVSNTERTDVPLPANRNQEERTVRKLASPTVLRTSITNLPNPEITFQSLFPTLKGTETTSPDQSSSRARKIDSSISDLRRFMKRMRPGSRKRAFSS